MWKTTLLLLAGIAHADTALPDATQEATRYAAVAVTELPRHATLRSQLFLTHHMGCSMSYQSTQEQIALTLTVDGTKASLTAEGNARHVSGGRASVYETPRVHREENNPIHGGWTGKARIEGDTLAINLQGWALTCRIRKLARDGAPGSPSVSGLVCEPAERGLPVPGLSAQLRHVPFGRGAGFQTSAYFPRGQNQDLPIVTAAR